VVMDSGPSPQVGNCRPKARPGMTIVGLFENRNGSRSFFLLPLWEKVARSAG
jgi:hypothetical protein